MELSKKLLCIISFAFCSSVYANQNNYMYAAANIGIFQAEFDHDYMDQTDVIAQNIQQPINQHSYVAGAAVGYRCLLKEHFFWGGELSINAVGNHASFQSGASTAAFSDNAQVQYYADLDFVPGMNLTESISSYLKLGLSLASVQDNLNSPIGFTPVYADYNTKKNVFGFAAGLGFSKCLSDLTTIFTEANYHDYGTVNFNNFQNFTASYAHSAHIYTYDIVVGAAYKFA